MSCILNIRYETRVITPDGEAEWDANLDPVGVSLNGISITLGKSSYGVGYSKDGLTYTSSIKDNGVIHGHTTTFTPKLRTAAQAVAQSIGDGYQNTANWLHNTFPANGGPPLSSPGGILYNLRFSL